MTRQRYIHLAVFGLLMSLFICLRPYTGECDASLHYLSARSGLLWSAWARPVCALVFAALSPMGYVTERCVMVWVAVLCCWLCFQIANQIGVRAWWAIIPLCLCQPFVLATWADTMTEPFMAAAMLFAWLALLKHWRKAFLITLGFLPLIRPEGFLIILAGIAVARYPLRLWPLAAIGTALWCIATKIFIGEWLWWATNFSWPVHTQAVYGSGTWYFFLANLPLILSMPLFGYFLLAFTSPIRRDGSCAFPVTCAIAFLAVHTVLWTCGLFGEAGLLRIFASLGGFFAILAAVGIDETMFSRSCRRPFICATLCIGIAISYISYDGLQFHHDYVPLRKCIEEAERIMNNGGKLISVEPLGYLLAAQKPDGLILPSIHGVDLHLDQLPRWSIFVSEPRRDDAWCHISEINLPALGFQKRFEASPYSVWEKIR